MKLEEIYQFIVQQPPNYLSCEQAVYYVLSVLLTEESYRTRLIQKLESEYLHYRLSDTVLYAALKFLEDEGVMIGCWQKVTERSRPRRMFQVSPEWLDVAQKLAEEWANSVTELPQDWGLLPFDNRAPLHALASQLLMRVQYGEQFCPSVISCESSPGEDFEKLVVVNYTPLPVVIDALGTNTRLIKQPLTT